jgi:MurNAc alpha-1-phosphate uridylyltransferase
MIAMLLAAGRGERMRPLTDVTPKPLLVAGGHALLDYHLHALARAGVREVVINLSWRGEMIREHAGGGERYGLVLRYSEEGLVPFETGGGIHRALEMLGPGPFLLVNGDVWTDLPLGSLELPSGSLAHLVLVANPEHNRNGDFALDARGRIVSEGPRLTYSGIGVIDPGLFADCEPGRFPLKPLLDRAQAQGRLTGMQWRGSWLDIGTPGRLAALDRDLRSGRLQHPALAAAGARSSAVEE